MTTVRVTVTSRQGDVEVEVQDPLYRPDGDGPVIDRLLVDAVTKVRRAYDIET